MSRSIFCVALAVFVAFQTCQSKLSNDVKPIACKVFIADPRLDILEVNTYVNSNGQNSSFFSLLTKVPGKCLDSKPTLTYNSDFYNADGTLHSSTSFTDDAPTVLGDQLNTRFWIVFSGAAYVKMKVTLTTKNQTSNTLEFTIKTPLGAI
jgi:hypothetical protein